MAISDLSTGDKIMLLELHSELNNTVKNRESIDDIIIPLLEKYDKLKDEEKLLDAEYEETEHLKNENLGFFEKESTKLYDIINRIKKIAEEKHKLEKQIIEEHTKYDEIRQREMEIESQIKSIRNGTKSTYLNSTLSGSAENIAGNYVTIKQNNLLGNLDASDLTANKRKDAIIQTGLNVMIFMKKQLEKVKTTSIDIPDLNEKISSVINKFIDDVKGNYNEDYKIEERKVQEILKKYRKAKEEQSKIEAAADNIQFVNSSDNTVDPKMDSAIYLDSSKDNYVQENEEVNEINNVDFGENQNAFNSSTNNNEIGVKSIENIVNPNSSETITTIIPYYQIDQNSSISKNKIARSNTTKVWGMQELFKKLKGKNKNEEKLKTLKAQKDSLEKQNQDNVINIFEQPDVKELAA